MPKRGGRLIGDKWDIAHIAVVVPDLAAAMMEYSSGFGIEWGPVQKLERHSPFLSDTFSDGLSVEGLQYVLSRRGGSSDDGSDSYGRLELIYAQPGSPAFPLFGCPDGRHFVHHICFWVDDVDVESRHLSSLRFEREMYAEVDGRIVVPYHRSAESIRIQLYDATDKLDEDRAERAL